MNISYLLFSNFDLPITYNIFTLATTSIKLSGLFFISGMINISYILFFIIDLSIDYNEFHQVTATKGLTLIFFTMITMTTNGFFVKNIEVQPLTFTKNS